MAVTSTFTPGIDEEVVLKDGANSKSIQAVILVSPTNGLPYAASGGGGGGGDATAANQTTGNASLASIDSKLGSAAVSRGAGAVDANTQRMTVASDGPLMTAIGAPADAAAGTDTATASQISLFKRLLQRFTLGAGTAAAALRVTLASDGPGVASLTSIDTKLGSAAVTRGSGVIDANTQRMTLATDGPGVSALTSIDGQYARIIDEVDATTTYECEAAPGTAAGTAAWRVKRIVRSGTVTTITWAGGAAFNQVASNRASLTYA